MVARRQPLGILPHSAFKTIAADARFDTYRRDPRMRVADETAFAEMQAHLDKLYEGIHAEHSFEDPAGRVFDCIPIDQQPSLRGHMGALPQPPDLNPVLQGKPPVLSAPAVMGAAPDARLDRHGNRMQAPPGTIPMRRVTLDEMCRFRDLHHFFRKHPSAPVPAVKSGGGSQPPRASSSPLQALSAGAAPQPSVPDADESKNHRYAYTHQTVDNIGGNSSLAVYAPAIDANQIFSLSQHWYTGGTGTGHQTLEVGWQVYPEKYGHALPVLFIFWTADNYVSTGAYNLDAPGFVQTNGAWTIGGALSPVSTQGGQQMEIQAAVYLYNGNWWIYMGGLGAENTIGYYPTSIYSGGQMATKATAVLYGGETICHSVSWPPMGSGANASAGWQQAAYQRNIFCFPPGGGAQWTALTPEQPSPACYTLSLAKAAAPWGVYFFYGGPGGGDC